ncbi:hypothetical protein EVAR_80559_1 [Eumeta japonica]|uniref:Uncharacterized protein n=1 Tax=Eumeta variegata TaxID=151549 RepID=A0A4C1TMD3_EUMVA|nr:hypothetical protein EVAR_80559_1 [Eumeta japonica]
MLRNGLTGVKALLAIVLKRLADPYSPLGNAYLHILQPGVFEGQRLSAASDFNPHIRREETRLIETSTATRDEVGRPRDPPAQQVRRARPRERPAGPRSATASEKSARQRGPAALQQGARGRSSVDVAGGTYCRCAARARVGGRGREDARGSGQPADTYYGWRRVAGLRQTVAPGPASLVTRRPTPRAPRRRPPTAARAPCTARPTVRHPVITSRCPIHPSTLNELI